MKFNETSLRIVKTLIDYPDGYFSRENFIKYYKKKTGRTGQFAKLKFDLHFNKLVKNGFISHKKINGYPTTYWWNDLIAPLDRTTFLNLLEASYHEWDIEIGFLRREDD
jgi:hypothetical protein